MDTSPARLQELALEIIEQPREKHAQSGFSGVADTPKTK
jgi:hypothetical protein